MGWALLEGIITILTFLIGVPLAIFDISRGKHLWGTVGMVLCLLPGPLGSMMLQVLSKVIGFEIEQ
jgi:hypothetical protein